MFLSHFFFNLIGAFVFSILRLPKYFAKSLAEKVVVYQWFGVVYIVGCFILLPLIGVLLALKSQTLHTVIVYTITSLLLLAWIITKLQEMFDITFRDMTPSLISYFLLCHFFHINAMQCLF